MKTLLLLKHERKYIAQNSIQRRYFFIDNNKPRGAMSMNYRIGSGYAEGLAYTEARNGASEGQREVVIDPDGIYFDVDDNQNVYKWNSI